MILRETKVNEIEDVMKIIDGAKLYFKVVGINQWQDGYPNSDTICDDINNHEAYVLEDDGKIIGTCMITINGEKTYNVIDGKWLDNQPYICVHRIAVDRSVKGKGLAKIILDQAIALHPQFHSVRMDTHYDNMSMQRFLDKYGFTYCGEITLENGDPRRGYEKILD